MVFVRLSQVGFLKKKKENGTVTTPPLLE